MANKHFFYAVPLLTLLSLAPDALLASVEVKTESKSAPMPKHKHPPMEGFKEKPKDVVSNKVEEKAEAKSDVKTEEQVEEKVEDKDPSKTEIASDGVQDKSEYQEDDLERLIHSLEKKDEVVKAEDGKSEAKIDAKEEKKEEVCTAGEQVKILTTQVEALMKEQNLILEAMLNLTKVMMNMSQNMQSQQPYFPMPQTAYQYHAPMAQGNWVYYPQGFQPGQQMTQGFYPDQAQMGQQQNWNLAPSAQYQMPMQQQQMQMPMQQPMMQQQMPVQQPMNMAPQMNQMMGYNMSTETDVGQFTL